MQKRKMREKKETKSDRDTSIHFLFIEMIFHVLYIIILNFILELHRKEK